MDARREGYRTERYRTGTYVTDHDTDPALPLNCPLCDRASTAAATQIDHRRPVIARLRCPPGRGSSSAALTVAAMARTVHVCTECGHGSAGWLGRCPGCG